MKRAGGKTIQIIISLLLLVVSGCTAPMQETQQSSGDTIVKGEASQLQPGLSVVYIFLKYRNVDQVPTGEAALRMGRQGEPVTMLNHQSGKEESVFASGRSQGVAMVMDGFMNLEKAGTYRWQALSNDGIRLFIDNTMIFEDPKVHPDRLTPTGTFEVATGGHYPVQIIYFQRKGTASLKLYWQPPGAEQFSLVPAEIYWH